MKTEKLKKIFSTKTARSVVVIAAVLLVGLAVYLNYRWFYDPSASIGYGDNNMEDNFDDSAETNMNAQQANDYFTSAALARRQSRDEALDVLGIVSSSEDADEQTRADAQAKMSKIASDIQNEANIEALVKAKGFDECVAVIGEDTVSVIVKAETLQAKDTAQILAIVYETTGISPEKISIINK
ncbi:MAG: SpoIIIAH-like family protein [Ruminococcaceae bacterium]|nr:SpoIIIAH-like family protein [Oscillospiraceae bacterium]